LCETDLRIASRRLAACFFIGGVVLLFVALYQHADRGGPLLRVAGLLLIATVACWIASARQGSAKADRNAAATACGTLLAGSALELAWAIRIIAALSFLSGAVVALLMREESRTNI
jgi:hypothetical protein